MEAKTDFLGNPRVSIVMCVYNNSKYIRDQIESIVAQTFQEWELIICDDKSTDQSLQIVHEYTTDQRIRILESVSNQGLILNFRKGAAVARGQYIAVSDGDDFWLPEKIEKQVLYLDTYADVSLVYHASIVADENLRPTGAILARPNTAMPKSTEVSGGQYLDMLLQQNLIPAHTMMIRRDFYVSIPMPMENSGLLHDHWICLNAAALSNIGQITEGLVLYRQHSNNIVGSRRRDVNYYLKKITNREHLESYAVSSKAYKNSLEELLSRTQQVHARSKINSKIISIKRICMLLEVPRSKMLGYYFLSMFYAIRSRTYTDLRVLSYFLISRILTIIR